MPNPVLSVGLPLYRSASTAWIAFEGLCRQEGAPSWELIIAEETSEPYAIGRQGLAAWRDRLVAAGCVRIIHVPLGRWVPLAEKWWLMCRMSANSSQLLAIQDSDCFSPPHRLAESYRLFRSGRVDWIHQPTGIFLHLWTGQQIQYDCRTLPRKTELNMAVATHLARRMRPPEPGRWRLTNGWMHDACTAAKGGPLRVARLDSDDWMRGVDTHGGGGLSRRDKAFADVAAGRADLPWTKAEFDVLANLPGDVSDRLRAMTGEGPPEAHVRTRGDAGSARSSVFLHWGCA